MAIEAMDLEIEAIRNSGVFGMDPAHVGTELHAAAFLHLGRRCVIENILGDMEEDVAIRGNRYIFRWGKIAQWADDNSGRKDRKEGKAK